MDCIIMVKSGILKMNNCILSLDGCTKETHRKVPCIVTMPNASIEIFHCNFKGDTLQDYKNNERTGSYTAGILSLKSDTTIHECSFAHFPSCIRIHRGRATPTYPPVENKCHKPIVRPTDQPKIDSKWTYRQLMDRLQI